MIRVRVHARDSIVPFGDLNSSGGTVGILLLVCWRSASAVRFCRSFVLEVLEVGLFLPFVHEQAAIAFFQSAVGDASLVQPPFFDGLESLNAKEVGFHAV